MHLSTVHGLLCCNVKTAALAWSSAGRPWYANLRPLAIPVVAAYILICIVYIVIRALKSVDAIASPAFGKVVLAFEVLGMVSLLQAGINHIYKVPHQSNTQSGCICHNASLSDR